PNRSVADTYTIVNRSEFPNKLCLKFERLNPAINLVEHATGLTFGTMLTLCSTKLIHAAGGLGKPLRVTAASRDRAGRLHPAGDQPPMCRGNFKGHYLAAGGYGSVAERFFSETRANHFLLEYDTDCSGDFAPLRFVTGKGVVLGLVSSKVAAL